MAVALTHAALSAPVGQLWKPILCGRRGKAAGCRAIRNVVSCKAMNPPRDEGGDASSASRRAILGALVASAPAASLVAGSSADDGYVTMDALKGKDYGKSQFRYEDFNLTESGLQYKDMREGQGEETVKNGDRVTVDWDGYTIGYYGRPFEARNKSKGGDFTGDEKDFFRYTVGAGQVVPGIDEATVGMKVGGIRRIVVPEELGYPNGDMRAAGPLPTTFSGKRALDFVLANKGMIDKTLLFDIELIRINK